MEKDAKTKIIAIIALFVAVLGVTVGFAALSKTFTINSTNTSTVEKGADPFITGLYLSATEGNGVVSDVTEGVTNKGVIWSGLTGTIKDNSRSISYTATINNISSYVAYLNSISSGSGKLTCTAVDAANTNNETVQAACDKLTLTVSVGSYTGTVTKNAALNASGLNTGTYSVDATTGTANVVLTLTLATDAVMPDGDFTVTIPAITFNYTTLKASN